MTDDFRRTANQGTVRNTLDFYCVIRNQTMSAFNQLNGSLALAYTAVAQNQDTFTINFYQHAMQRNAGCQRNLQGCNQCTGYRGGKFVGTQNRNIIFFRSFYHFRNNINISCNDNRRNAGRTQFIKNIQTLFAVKLFHIGIFNLTHDLQAICFKVIKEACQLQARTIDIIRGNFYLFKAFRPINNFKLKFGDQLAQCYAEFFQLHV